MALYYTFSHRFSGKKSNAWQNRADKCGSMFLHRMSFKKVNRSLPQEWHWGLPFTCAEIFKITCAEIVALPFFRSLAPKCLWKPRNYQLITCKAVQETILWATLLSNCLTNYQYTNGSTLQAFRFICCCTLCKKRHDTLVLDLAGFLFSPALVFFPDLFCFPSPTSILPLPFHAGCYLQHFGAGTFHFACYLQHLGAGTFHAACYLQHFGAGTFYFACYLPHLGAGTFHLSCYLPHLRAGTFQFACYL